MSVHVKLHGEFQPNGLVVSKLLRNFAQTMLFTPLMYNSRHILHLFTVITVAVLAISCSEHSADRLLASADSLMNTRPDSAYSMLDSLSQQNAHASESLRMRIELLKAKAQNKAYLDFTTDSVMLEVADYFDHHGTPNDRMLAHYLLGCTYRDMKEAPMSLQCYYDAVDAADTTTSDCDYQTMMSIYGQIATILDKQYMPLEELDAWNNYQKYALLACDTFNYIRGIEMCVGAYNILADTANILKTIEQAVVLYKRHGHIKQAAIANASAIYVYLDKHNYSKAKALQQIYENESGLFDYEGNIARGKEHFYCGKGLLYLGLNELDSAEIYYRKLLDSGFRFDAYKGLLQLYQRYQDNDSVLLYSTLLSEAYNERITEQHAQAMHQVKDLYDYTRNKKISSDKAKETYDLKVAISVIIIIVIIAVFILSYYQLRYKMRKTEEKRKATWTYYETLSQLKNAQGELAKLEIGFDRFKEQKQLEISELKKQIDCLNQHSSIIDNEAKIEYIKEHPIVKSFKRNLEPGVSIVITNQQWELFSQFIHTIIPDFYLSIQSLRKQEQHVAILTKLGFTNNETAYILQISKQQVTNARSHANLVLFQDNSARTFTNNIQKL